MEIKIGLQHVQRELVIDAQASAEELEASLREALSGGGLVSLSDAKGRKVLVPADKIAYVDLGAEHQRQVGFGAL